MKAIYGICALAMATAVACGSDDNNNDNTGDGDGDMTGGDGDGDMTGGDGDTSGDGDGDMAGDGDGDMAGDGDGDMSGDGDLGGQGGMGGQHGTGGPAYEVRTVDATAGGLGAPVDDPNNKWTYFDLESGAVLDLTDAEAASDSDWDIAFKRTDAKLNGGVSGPGGVSGSIATAQAFLYDNEGAPIVSEFELVTPESELDSFLQASEALIDFEVDSYVSTIDEIGWYDYNFVTHAVTPNADNYFVVRSSDGGSYVRAHVTALTTAGRALGSLTLESTSPGAVGDVFTGTQTFVADFSEKSSVYYDFDTNSEVTEDSENWDLRLDSSFNIWLNSRAVHGTAGGGAAYGPITTETLAVFPKASDIFAGAFFADKVQSVLTGDGTAWYAYGLKGMHRLWPTFRTYLLDTASGQYKVQLLNYYNEMAVSGHITFRYAAL